LSIIVLSAQVPENHVAALARGRFRRRTETLWFQLPELHAVGGSDRSLLRRRTRGNPVRQIRLADVALAHQHDFGAGVGNRRRGGLGEHDGEIQFIDVDEAVTQGLCGILMFRRAGFGTDHGEEGQTGMEGKAGEPGE
jgi:hypothetical protein